MWRDYFVSAGLGGSVVGGCSCSRGTGGGVVAMTYPIQPRIARTANTATKAVISKSKVETTEPARNIREK